ncbi:hypothetical protein [Pseudooceanicola sp.]|uniref:hypothetical protein n=1 Tax=Pseudooceanicola sp. TaxID=1914328 RepID=UPI0040588C57
MQDTLAEVSPSRGRQFFAVAVLLGMGALLLRMTFAGAGTSWLDGLVLAMSVVAFYAAWIMYRSTDRRILLTTEGLFLSDGCCLGAIDDIVSVDRGTFTFKPSNGFLVRMRNKGVFMWQPGLYWRMGRRIGVGGIAHAAQCKQMADMLSIRLAERTAEAAGH